MEPALDVMNRALQGDATAQAILEQTTQTYVLQDNNHTYGCWNFIHQGLTEVERFEAASNHHTSKQVLLTGHVQLLARMALTAARRSPQQDAALLPQGAQRDWWISLHHELRDIVLGRIAATTLDPSLTTSRSALAHAPLGAVLAANAISTGSLPDWILQPGLPVAAVATVLLHLALEARESYAPAYTQRRLQELSWSVTVQVLVPALRDEQEPRTIATCLKALRAWSLATELSLPQMNHLCQKHNLNVISIWSDTMYSESSLVLDALADLLETTLTSSPATVARMQQVRILLQVDEATFASQFSTQHLQDIERAELRAILDELVTAVGLQRFRFVERQEMGGNGCRHLARIGAVVSQTYLDMDQKLEAGALTLLLKAAAHPSRNVGSLVLPVLVRCLDRPELALELLPHLQRKVIVPHAFRNGSFVYTESNGSCADFLTFRENMVRPALIACFQAHPNHYMGSCMSAVEEFCVVQSPVDVALQLEAVLYCVEIVSSVEQHEYMIRMLNALSMKTVSLMTNPITRARVCRMLAAHKSWLINLNKVDLVSETCRASFLAFATNQYVVGMDKELVHLLPNLELETAKALKVFLVSCPSQFATEAGITGLQAVWDACYASAMPVEARIVFAQGYLNVVRSMPKYEEHLVEQISGRCVRQIEETQCQLTFQKEIKTEAQVLKITTGFSTDLRLLCGIVESFLEPLPARGINGTNEDKQTKALNHGFSMLRKVWPSIQYIASHHFLQKLFQSLAPVSFREQGLGLLKDLAALCTTIVKEIERQGDRLNTAFRCLEELVKVWGSLMENTLVVNDVQSRNAEASRCIEELIITVFTEGRTWLGPAYSKTEIPSRSCNGQALTLLTTCVEHCPQCISTIVQHSGSSDRILHLGVRLAVDSLKSIKLEPTKQALSFVNVLATEGEQKLKPVADEFLHHYRLEVLQALVTGCCGQFDASLLESTALLLDSIRQVSNHEVWVSTFKVSAFLLGQAGQNACLSFFRQPASPMLDFCTDLWEAHRVKETLETSDICYQFCQKYGCP